ncbi:MAG TPA: DUF3105 domain-containing protein [Acidimicrobiia bacterium]
MSNTKRRPQPPTTKRAAKSSASNNSLKTWLAIGGFVVVVALVAVVVLSGVESRGPSGIPEGTRVVAVGDPAHVEGDIDYGVLVPAGGPHNPQWQNCGFYSTPIRPENALHSLEHAAVWVTYRTDADGGTLDELRRLAGNHQKLVISPVQGQTPLVMATAWGHQLDLESASDSRLSQFLNEFEGTAGYAPEPQGICFSGVGIPES